MKSVNESSATFDQLLSVRQVEGMIADGHTIIILHQKVLKLDAWMKYHPGGHKPIQHMVGRDATDEVAMSEEQNFLLGFNRTYANWNCADSTQKKHETR